MHSDSSRLSWRRIAAVIRQCAWPIFSYDHRATSDPGGDLRRPTAERYRIHVFINCIQIHEYRVSCVFKFMNTHLYAVFKFKLNLNTEYSCVFKFMNTSPIRVFKLFKLIMPPGVTSDPRQCLGDSSLSVRSNLFVCWLCTGVGSCGIW